MKNKNVSLEEALKSVKPLETKENGNFAGGFIAFGGEGASTRLSLSAVIAVTVSSFTCSCSC